MLRFLVVSSSLLLGFACGDQSMSMDSGFSGTSRPAGPESLPPPSFDACYPWQEGMRREPPIFQLMTQGTPLVYLMVMPGYAVFGDSDDPNAGWKSGFSDTEFMQLWELSKLARQRHSLGEDLSNEAPIKYTMSIGCGDFFSWHVTVSEAFADRDDDAAAQLASQFFELIRTPPLDAITE